MFKEVIETQRIQISKLEISLEFMNDEKFFFLEKIEKLEEELESKNKQEITTKRKFSERKLHLDKIDDSEEDYKLLKKKYKKVKKELRILKKGDDMTSVTKLAFYEKERELDNAKKAFRELQLKVFDLLEENEKINKQLEYFTSTGMTTNQSELDSMIF